MPRLTLSEPRKTLQGQEKETYDDASDGGDEEETSEQEFQKATDALCIDGGASLHSSNRQLKRCAREVNVVESAPEARKPLKWSRITIIFDEEDHPDRTTTTGCLLLLVSPIIRNLKVTKMLVDGRAGLNLISPTVISKLQIGEEELEVTCMFQGVNPGRSHPKGKIMLPVTFGGELNYRLRRLCLMWLISPYHTMGFFDAWPCPSSWKHPTMLTTP